MKIGHHYRWPVFALWAQHAAAYGKMETFEVSLMRCIYKGKQFSWLLALSVPPGIAGFILHTPYSFLWGIIGFILCGLIGPFLYYFVKREDLGDAEGPYHSAAHLAAWSALSVFFLAIVWCFLDLFQEIWEREMIFAALSIPVMAVAVFLSMLLDDALAHVYIFLRRKNENISTLGCMLLFYRSGSCLDYRIGAFYLLFSRDAP